MSNKYEEILDNQGNQVEEGFQKILLKEVKVNEYESEFHDVGLDIEVAPVDYPNWKIKKTIWGDWNFSKKQQDTIWKITGTFDVINQLTGNDVSSKELFDLHANPAVLDKEKVTEVNNSFDNLEVYGYLFKGRRKNANADRLFWNIHSRLAVNEESQTSIENSFKKWKSNDMVQKYWVFDNPDDNNSQEDDLSFNFGSNIEQNEEVELEAPKF